MSLTHSSIIRSFQSIHQYVQTDENVNKLRKIEKIIKSRRQHHMRNQIYLKEGIKKKIKKDRLSNIQDVKNEQNHKIPLQKLYKNLKTDPNKGLTQIQAKKRLNQDGLNQLTEQQKIPWVILFIKQMADPFSLFIWLLIILSFIGFSLIPTDYNTLTLALILLITIISGAIISFKFNRQSQDIIDSIKQYIPHYTSVLRDGNIKIIKSQQLVVGDIVIIQPGQKIPADLRIIESVSMKVDQSTFTGQSIPKRATVQCSNYQNPLQSKNMVFSGSVNNQGQGRGIVLKTGDDTMLAKIASQILSVPKKKSSIENQISRYVVRMTIWALFIGTLVLTLGMAIGFTPLIAVMIAIGVTVASAPGVLNLVLTIMLTFTVKKLAKYEMIAKNLFIIESIGSTSCLCTDKTGTLTLNKMQVSQLWYDGKRRLGQNMQKFDKNHQFEYSTSHSTFRQINKCAVLSSFAKFNRAPPKQVLLQIGSNKLITKAQKQKKLNKLFNQYTNQIDKKKYFQRPVLGDPSETALIKFFQPIFDVQDMRRFYKLYQDSKTGVQVFLPFSSDRKYSMAIVKQASLDSQYTLYTKGAPQAVLNLCTHMMIQGKIQIKTQKMNRQILQMNRQFANRGQRILAFAKYDIPKPKNDFNFRLQPPSFIIFQQVFLGLISLNDPLKKGVQKTMLSLKSAGIKVIMLTGDQPETATAIGRMSGIITSEKTVNQIMEQKNIDMETAMLQSKSIVIHGDDIMKMRLQDEGLARNRKGQKLNRILQMKQIIFARTSPYHKYIIVEALQKLGHIVAVTGDGVNDSPAVKLADVGLCMGSGSDATRDAADIIISDDDISHIVNGIYQGRKMFDNLKKSICYVMTSQASQFLPFICLLSLRIPIPVFTLLIDGAVDFLPSISFAYEQGERGIMTRKPRYQQQHLVTAKLIGQCTGWMGITQFIGSFACYFICMSDFGFDIRRLWQKSNIPILVPLHSDTYNPSSKYWGNSNLQKITSCAHFEQSTQGLDWINSSRPWADLRMSAVLCQTLADNSIRFVQNMFFSQCRVQQISIVTNKPICYTTQATKYGQTSYMAANVIGQVFNLFICKTKRQSVFIQSMDNYMMYLSIAVQYLLLIALTQTSFMIALIGTRDIIFLHYGLAAIPFGILQISVEQLRKYLIRNLPKNNKGHKDRKNDDCQPNWFDRNILW